MTAFQIIGLIVLCLAMLCSLTLIIVGLPGTWIVLVLAVAAGAIEGFSKINLTYILVLLGLALFGELLELLIGYFGSRLKGASRLASLVSLIFSIVGAFALSGFVPVVGSIIGAFAGAFLGAFAIELITRKPLSAAYKSGLAAMFGRGGSIVSKIAVGVAMIVIVIVRLI